MVFRGVAEKGRQGEESTRDDSECQDADIKRFIVAFCFILQYSSSSSLSLALSLPLSLPFVFSGSLRFSLLYSRIYFSPLLARTRIIDECCYATDFRFATSVCKSRHALHGICERRRFPKREIMRVI